MSHPPTPPEPGPSASSRSASASTAQVVRSLQRSRMERRTVYLIVGAVVGIWLFVVFATALADASEQSARLVVERQKNAELQARAKAGAAEIETIQGSTFQEFLARSYGMGETAERPFALAPGAPSPAVMVPLGAHDAEVVVTTPLEDWMDLLIGS